MSKKELKLYLEILSDPQLIGSLDLILIFADGRYVSLSEAQEDREHFIGKIVDTWTHGELASWIQYQLDNGEL